MADRPNQLRQQQPLDTTRHAGFDALVAAARVITQGRVPGRKRKASKRLAPWQAESWDFYDNCGEYRFGVTWLASAMSRVPLVPARTPDNAGDGPTVLVEADEDAPRDEQLTAIEQRTVELVEFIAGGPAGQALLMESFGRHLAVAGFGWLVAEPDIEDPGSDQYVTWTVYPTEALRSQGSGDDITYEVLETGGRDGWRKLHPYALVIECWRRHPARPWEADAPVRANLPILRQIDSLTGAITATANSQLAGRGLQLLPLEIEFPRQQRNDDSTDDQGDEVDDASLSDFAEVLRDYATTPIADRDSAARYAPLIAQVPGEYLAKIPPLIEFSTKFDERAQPLLEFAIRRLALGMDLPPEVLTGMADVNHWTAWQVEESAINLHVRPPCQVVAWAMTTGYLRPVLRSEGYAQADVDRMMVWFDVTDLQLPPDRSENATEAFNAGELKAEAWLRELGLSADDMPEDDEKRVRLLLSVARGLPSAAPGILQVLGIITADEAGVIAALMGGGAPPGAAAPPEPTEPPPPPPGQPPAPEPPAEGPPEEGDRQEGARTAALLEACDGLVWRAMERAGSKLRSQAGRRVRGGPSAIDCTDPAMLHTELDPTVFADLDQLLDGAWSRVDAVAARHGLEADALRTTLNAYARGLLAAQQPHDMDRLAHALGCGPDTA